MCRIPRKFAGQGSGTGLEPPTICGGMPEWTNGAVLKTAVPLRVPEVRILLPPQIVGGRVPPPPLSYLDLVNIKRAVTTFLL